MKPFTFLIPFLVLFGISCGGQESQSETVNHFLHIKLAPAIHKDMIDTVRIYGKVKLRQEAFLASQFDGRLADFTLLMGDLVRTNERIATIIPAEREALLQVMENVDTSTRSVLEKQIKTIPLLSPMSGIVLDVIHHSGDVLQKGETIAHIGDLQVLDVYGDLPVQYLRLVSKMKRITVSFVAYPHAPLSLPIKTLSGRVDEAKQTVPIRLELENRANEYRPGMLVQIVFPDKVHESALVIPRSALLEEEGVYSAFVVIVNKVEKRDLQIGILQNDWVEILSGLQEGEQVAIQKAYSLTDGMEVVVE